MNSSFKNLLLIYLTLFYIISCKPLDNKFRSLVDDDEITTITSDSETDF